MKRQNNQELHARHARAKSDRSIAFVFGDRESGGELLRLYEAIGNGRHPALNGIRVDCYADSVAPMAEILGRHHIYHFDLYPIENHHAPEAIVVGTSTVHRQFQDAWTAFGAKRGIPVIWLNGSHGAAVLARDGGGRLPSAVIAIDSLDAALTRRDLPDDAVQVVPCGKPSLAFLGNLLGVRSQVRRNMRQMLELPDDRLLVTYWSGEDARRTHAQLAALLAPWLFTQAVTLLVRINKRMRSGRPMLSDLVQRAAAQHPDAVYANERLAHGVVGHELLAASDVVVTDWSAQEALLGLASGIPTATCLFPDGAKGPVPLTDLLIDTPYLVPDVSCLVRVSGETERVVSSLVRSAAQNRTGSVERHAFFEPLLSVDAPDRMCDVIADYLRKTKAA